MQKRWTIKNFFLGYGFLEDLFYHKSYLFLKNVGFAIYNFLMLFTFYKLKTLRNFGSFKCYNRNIVVNWQRVADTSVSLSFRQRKQKWDILAILKRCKHV